MSRFSSGSPTLNNLGYLPPEDVRWPLLLLTEPRKSKSTIQPMRGQGHCVQIILVMAEVSGKLFGMYIVDMVDRFLRERMIGPIPPLNVTINTRSNKNCDALYIADRRQIFS